MLSKLLVHRPVFLYAVVAVYQVHKRRNLTVIADADACRSKDEGMVANGGVIANFYVSLFVTGTDFCPFLHDHIVTDTDEVGITHKGGVFLKIHTTSATTQLLFYLPDPVFIP
jgi:hypothetical protein